MLPYYAERFDGVELNGSFYRTPPAETLTKWAEATPAQFRFCFKAHRGITYSSDRFDRVGLAADFRRRLEPVGQRLGPVLLQFPPTRQVDGRLLEAILEALNSPAAVEFRHESWLRSEVFDSLRRYKAALVVTDQEKWPLAPVLDIAPFAYFRLRRDYDEEALRAWAATLRAQLAGRDEVHVYFKHEPEAPARALLLRALIDSQ